MEPCGGFEIETKETAAVSKREGTTSLERQRRHPTGEGPVMGPVCRAGCHHGQGSCNQPGSDGRKEEQKCKPMTGLKRCSSRDPGALQANLNPTDTPRDASKQGRGRELTEAYFCMLCFLRSEMHPHLCCLISKQGPGTCRQNKGSAFGNSMHGGILWACLQYSCLPLVTAASAGSKPPAVSKAGRDSSNINQRVESSKTPTPLHAPERSKPVTKPC